MNYSIVSALCLFAAAPIFAMEKEQRNNDRMQLLEWQRNKTNNDSDFKKSKSEPAISELTRPAHNPTATTSSQNQDAAHNTVDDTLPAAELQSTAQQTYHFPSPGVHTNAQAAEMACKMGIKVPCGELSSTQIEFMWKELEKLKRSIVKESRYSKNVHTNGEAGRDVRGKFDC